MREMGIGTSRDGVSGDEKKLWPAILNRLLTRMNDPEVTASGVKAEYAGEVKEEMPAQQKAELILRLLAEKNIPEKKVEAKEAA